MLTRYTTHALTLKYRNVALLEAWGIEVFGAGTSARIRSPYKKEAVLRMLSRYIAKETSLPADQRITAPTLAEVTTAHNALATASLQRVEATATRELAIRQRGEAAQALLLALKNVAFHHVTYHFGGMVDQNLQTLGFDLVTRTRPPSAPENGGTTHRKKSIAYHPTHTRLSGSLSLR